MGIVADSGGGATNLTSGVGNYYGAVVVQVGSLYWVAAGRMGPFIETMLTSGGTPSGLDLAATTAVADDGGNYYLGSITICQNGMGAAGCQAYTSANTSNFVVAGGYLYWTDDTADVVRRCAVGSPCSSPTQIASTSSNPQGLAVDGTNVYWLDSGGLKQCNVNGCANSPLLLSAGATGTGPAANDAAYVYWISGSTINRATVGSVGSQTAIAMSQVGAANVTVDSTSVYWSLSSGAIMKLGK
jgi:hypothetical protein